MIMICIKGSSDYNTNNNIDNKRVNYVICIKGILITFIICIKLIILIVTHIICIKGSSGYYY